jgi:hypothetical protein
MKGARRMVVRRTPVLGKAGPRGGQASGHHGRFIWHEVGVLDT